MPTGDCTSILKALSDRTRMRLVKLLLAEDRSVNDLGETLDVSQYNVSKHLRILRQAGIVKTEKAGKNLHCTVDPELKRKIARNKNQLDLGCCTFRFDY